MGGRQIECDNCGSKFVGAIPAVHLLECKNIPIKQEDKTIDHPDEDFNFMPGTPENGENESCSTPLFKLGSNYPSNFGTLLVNAIQGDLAHNGIEDEHDDSLFVSTTIERQKNNSSSPEIIQKS